MDFKKFLYPPPIDRSEKNAKGKKSYTVAEGFGEYHEWFRGSDWEIDRDDHDVQTIPLNKNQVVVLFKSGTFLLVTLTFKGKKNEANIQDGKITEIKKLP